MAYRELKADLLERIAKLIRMLASQNDGEVLAAARAIIRELDRDGADIHDLARLLSYDILSSGVGSGAGFETERMTRNRALVRCSECLLHSDQLTEPELEFVQLLEERLSIGAPFTRNEIRRLKNITDRVEPAGPSDHS